MKNEELRNLAATRKPTSQKKFSSMLKKAEEGEFSTLEESKNYFEEWRMSLKFIHSQNPSINQ